MTPFINNASNEAFLSSLLCTNVSLNVNLQPNGRTWGLKNKSNERMPATMRAGVVWDAPGRGAEGTVAAQWENPPLLNSFAVHPLHNSYLRDCWKSGPINKAVKFVSLVWLLQGRTRLREKHCLFLCWIWWNANHRQKCISNQKSIGLFLSSFWKDWCVFGLRSVALVLTRRAKGKNSISDLWGILQAENKLKEGTGKNAH